MFSASHFQYRSRHTNKTRYAVPKIAHGMVVAGAFSEGVAAGTARNPITLYCGGHGLRAHDS